MMVDMRVGVVCLIAVLFGCASGIVETTSTSSSSTTTSEAAWASFFFRQDPILFDVLEPTFEQLEAFDNVDVPRGTTVLIPTSRLEGLAADTGEIQIMDVMRGPASSQEINVFLVDGEQWIATIRFGSPRSHCGNDTLEALDIRGTGDACRHPDESWVAWSEAGRNYRATTRSNIPANGLVAWVEDLRPVELGNAGPPYMQAFCAAEPTWCDLPGDWVLNATTPDPG
jgi:hypothetical protein